MSFTNPITTAVVKVGILNLSRDSRKKLVVTSPLLNIGNRCECHRSSRMTIINGCPVSQYVWHPKEPSLLNGHECRG